MTTYMEKEMKLNCLRLIVQLANSTKTSVTVLNNAKDWYKWIIEKEKDEN